MTFTPFKNLLAGVALACLMTPLSTLAASTDALWHDVAQRSLPANAPQPAQFRALSLDSRSMAAYLARAHARGIATGVSLPLPEGGFSDFNVVDSGTLPPELQKKYPEILSFKGTDEKGRRLRLDVSPLGFQAMVFDTDGIWLVRPEVIASGNDNYLSYRRAGLSMAGMDWQCQTHADPVSTLTAATHPKAAAPSTVTGAQQRVYRAAVAANNNYVAAVGGGTVAGGLAAVTTAVNRVTEVYEYEMSIRLVLVPNNNLIIYPNAGNDPFSSNGTGVINNSTSVINAAIGSGNYDIGHVFTTGSGGVAGLGVVCGGSKARGTTGLSNPIGDDFYIDFVAHEMGHQFDGNHPFNGSNGNCSGGNRNGSTAYEPGSGSSIMAYAGICGADDLQPHSDPYFHAISLQEITNFTNGSGNCSVNTAASNQPPVIAPGSLPPSGKTIPVQTPFMLYASATDPNNDGLAYSWEEWDLGPQAPLSAGDNGSSPIFRSYSPVASGVRSFPAMSTVLGGPAIKGEIVPTKSRTAMKFRLTVRDRSDAAHGWGTSQSADYQVAVTNTAGPFKVNSPGGSIIWPAGGMGSVTWDVANTNAAPVSCASVDIDLSLDAGATFTSALAVGVPNSGSASVAVPIVSTTQARVRVSCSDNVFFNVSPANFTVAPGGTVYTVGGNVSGLNGSGLVLRINGSNDLPVSANGAFEFAGGYLDGTAYTVTVGTQPSSPYQQCTVDHGTGAISGANVTDVAVTCVDLQTYTVGGTINGLTANGLKLKLNGGSELSVAANATAFTFASGLLDFSSYSVTISAQPLGQTCSITGNTGTISGANVNSVALNCIDNPPEAFPVGGKVTGLSAPGLVLQLNGGLTLTRNFDGIYAFNPGVTNGATYTVTVLTHPAGQHCIVSNATGTMGFAAVTNVDVTCATATVEIFKDGFEGND
ncbi:MAG TPA: M12 family metallo-peptidase [Chiayiivirga sp.]|nr:M12 family metallo-peptidase [Chiayiivirga sp.]